MNDNRSGGKPTPLIRLLAVVVVLIFFFIRQNSDNDDFQVPILILIAAIFIGAFGALIWQGIKEWKKTDEEILAGFSPMVNMIGLRNVRAKDGFRYLAGMLLAIAYFLYNEWGNPSFTDLCVFFGISLSVICIPMLYTRYIETKALSSTPPEKPRITGEQVAAFLIGLLSCGFICFFIGIGTYHGAWWFVMPPGLIFLFLFSRNLVAAVRTMIRPPKTEVDPWDRPDIER